MRRPVVFVTDFGRDDTYAAALAGAAWRAEPDLRCVDGTHGVPPGDVLAGAYHLKALARAFGAVVLCGVVDPGVGTARRAIAADLGSVTFVGPDNGLVSYLWAEADPLRHVAVTVPVPEAASATFHGRDVFAPTAARIAAGMPLRDCGDALEQPVVLGDAFATRDGNELRGRVVVVDHFGNAITTIRDADLHDAAPRSARWDGGGTDRAARTYEDIDEGVAVIVGSAGHLEIAACGRRAQDAGGPSLHQDVILQLA